MKSIERVGGSPLLLSQIERWTFCNFLTQWELCIGGEKRALEATFPFISLCALSVLSS